MAYSAIVSLMNTLELIVRSDRFQSLYVKQHVLFLHQKIQLLETLSEEKSFEGEEMELLETQIRDAAYRIEDMVESFTRDQTLSNLRKKDSPHKDYPRLSTKKIKRKKEEFEEAIAEIDSIIGELSRDKYGHKGSPLPPRKYVPVGGPTRPPRGGKSTVMVGVDEDVIELKDRLVGRESKLQTIPIVGMGGIGKTTLARNLFDDALVKYHFHVRAWATISQTYVVHDVLRSLLNDLGVVAKNILEISIQDLIERLYKHLKGRRYLIVLDDMWNTQVWDDLRRIFPDDTNGSRIMLTSRLVEVVTYATDSSSPPYGIRLLDEEKCWDLLCREVFAQEGWPPEFKELEDVGKKIAHNCKGLPLSITVIGGVLAKSSMTREFWEYVARNVNSIAIESDEHCSEILSLSYKNLPRHLQPCFLYFGIFREDVAISVKWLIGLWIAEGFLKPSRSTSLEEVAEEYLQDLIERNLVFVRERNYDGRTKTCGIHDFLRDLCIKEARKANFLHIIDGVIPFSPGGMNFPRRLSIGQDIKGDCCITDVIFDSMESMKLARSLVGTNYSLLPYWKFFTLLRVLDIWNANPGMEFPDDIFLLVNLRYLAIRSCAMPELLSHISAVLLNLQFLIIPYCWSCSIEEPSPLTEKDKLNLAAEILQMTNLRHLEVGNFSLPNPIDKNNNLPILNDLHTLSKILNFKCTGEVLKKFPNLRKLVVCYDDRIEDWSEFHLENLVHFSKLENLNCEFNWFVGDDFLQNAVLPQSLKKLALNCSRLQWKEMTIIGLLPNLEVLKLRQYAFMGPVWESVEGEFRQLKYLEIYLADLNEWIAENTHFPSLKKLVIRSCWYLEEIPSGIGEIETLEMIEIDDASNSAIASAEKILEEQQSMGNYVLQVRVDSWRPKKEKITTPWGHIGGSTYH